MKELTVISLGVPQYLTPAAEQALSLQQKLFLQTDEHVCVRLLRSRGVIGENALALDEFYMGSFDFDELNESIADKLISAFDEDGVSKVGFAALGSGAGADLVKMIREKADSKGITVSFIPAIGFANAALYAAFSSGSEYFSDYDLFTANSLDPLSSAHNLVIEEVDTLLRAGEVKLRLADYYPDEHIVTVMKMDEQGIYQRSDIPLYELDHNKNAALYGADTVFILHACSLTERTRHGLDSLIEVMHALRAPGGCPWDAEQTHKSLRSSLIEESYEVLDALDREDNTALEEELGDLLLQIVFHAVIEEERSEFTMRDVITGVVNKLIYRHPHVFGDVKVNSSDDVLFNWENLKKKEKHQSTVADAMRSVPAAFPALMRSYKIQKKASHVGFDWKSALDALPKVVEEADEVRGAIEEGSEEHRFEEMGDLLFACVNVSRLMKVDPELALNAASDKFMTRFIKTEALIIADGRDFSSMTLDEMDKYWDMVKKSE